MEPYRSYFPHSHSLLSGTGKIIQRVLIMPTGTSIEPTQIVTVRSIIRLAISNPSVIRNRLKEIS